MLALRLRLQVAPLFSASWEAAASQQATQDSASFAPGAGPTQGTMQMTQVGTHRSSLHRHMRLKCNATWSATTQQQFSILSTP